MELKTSVPKNFLDLFYNEIECEIPDTQSKLNLRILKIENNRFCYDDLVEKLAECVVHFTLSRTSLEDLSVEGKYSKPYREAVRRFRDYTNNDGEAGELLLYCFLEAHLNAPKIVSKLELKTSSNDYVKGSDGVHILKLDDKEYQLIFGESKLHTGLTSSLSEAFQSIHDFIYRPKNNINHEISIINTQLLKEAYDEDLYKLIKEIIIPKANHPKEIKKDNAFAIFAGFNIELSDVEKKMGNREFEIHLRNRIRSEVEGKKENIKNKIQQHQLYGYTFYTYIFPFIDIENTRKKIIQKLTTP
ncbi:HamA C-terminal domain-containing protein [Leptospira alexanderi]|uniref:PF08878 domain protein n=1 Tax=Leptospira alexanderi serovar Manhao 3 str. L 60 TaxID=1049759 RepID=V6HTU5_9LEPT|nr:DUF1837 domain-containing protein [Leptospira alexanderi]EQA60626.1 PF08878 domain protein [Leptospira alexanderi serovar Manhao 3 str. L 60]